MFRNIKTVKHVKAQSFLVGGLWIFKVSQISLHLSTNQHKKFMTSKYQSTT